MPMYYPDLDSVRKTAEAMTHNKGLTKFETQMLDEILLSDDGTLRILPAAHILAIPQDRIAAWCHMRGRYGLPTEELIAWLKTQINGLTAIEIGAGSGDLGRHLGIPQSDSCLQDIPEIAAVYKAMHQPTIAYPKFVELLTAENAIKKYQPEVVIGSWITQLGTADVKDSSPFGVNEIEMLKKIKKYIMIGHSNVHINKQILELPHDTFMFDWICSRPLNRSGNLIFVWERIQ